MAESRIPEEIKRHHFETCTEIKFISGQYYVYMYQSLRLLGGKWGKKTGKSIGTIIPENWFYSEQELSFVHKRRVPG